MWESIFITCSLLSAVLSAALGIGCFLAINRLGRLQATEPPCQEVTPVTVITPARNEELDLEDALRSVLAQQDIDLRVVLVNDHSTDRTGEIADRLAATDPRITVIHHPVLRDGWLGKVNAMQSGLEAAATPFVIFTDADIVHQPRCFVSALEDLRSSHVDLLSLLPRFIFNTFWENVLYPHAMVAGVTQFMYPDVNDPKTRNAAAAGAFILLRREVLEQLGGLSCIRSEAIDDLMLARKIKQAGFKTRLKLAPHLLSVKFYKNNWDAFWGPTKNMLASFRYPWMAIPAMFLPVIVYWIPITTLLWGVWNQKLLVAVAGAIPLVIQSLLILLTRPICRLHWWKALCFPLAVIPVIACLSRALYHHYRSGGVYWRGRVLRAGSTPVVQDRHQAS